MMQKSNVETTFKQILGNKTTAERSAELDEKTRKVIIHWLNLQGTVVDQTSGDILGILKQTLEEKTSLHTSFLSTLFLYLQYGFRTTHDSLQQTIAPITMPLFRGKDKKQKIAYLREIVGKLEEPLLEKFYEHLLDIAVPTTKVHGSGFDTHEFTRLNSKTKKSVALYALATELLLQHPEYLQQTKTEFLKKLKSTLEEIILKLKKVWDEDNNIIYSLNDYGMPSVVWMIGEAYISDESNATYRDLQAEMGDLFEDEVEVFEQLFLLFQDTNPGILLHHRKIFGINGQVGADDSVTLAKPNGILPIDSSNKTGNGLLIPTKVERQFQLSFNPLVNNFNIEELLKGWGKEIMQTSYVHLFAIADRVLAKLHITPQATTIPASIKTKDLQPEVTHGGKTRTVLTTRDSNEMTEQEIQILGSLIRHDFETFGLKATEYRPLKKTFQRPFSAERADFYGFFQNNHGFESMHLVLYRNKENFTEKKLVFSSGEDLQIHEHLYYYIQINYFLKHKKFLPQEVVYANIYHECNQQGDGDLFDITISENQYEQFIKYIVWPLSKEAIDKKAKATSDHTVLAGLAGTGKSQMLKTLLRQKTYKYKEQDLHLNSVVVSITISEFLQTIQKNDFFIQRIHKKTGMPVILVIEDLDTILSDEDQENQGSFIVQTITNFLEGVGETPVTLVVSTNFLHRFPQRILRPKRFNKIIAYPTTPSEKEFRAIAEQHIKKRKIDVEWLDILMNMRERMEYYSAAYIAKVVESIQEYTDFIQIFGGEEMSKEKLLEQILAEMVVPLEDIKAADRQFQETVNGITGKLKRTQIGYK